MQVGLESLSQHLKISRGITCVQYFQEATHNSAILAPLFCDGKEQNNEAF